MFSRAVGILTKKHYSLKKVPSVAGDGFDMVVLGEKEKELCLTVLLSVCLVLFFLEIPVEGALFCKVMC